MREKISVINPHETLYTSTDDTHKPNYTQQTVMVLNYAKWKKGMYKNPFCYYLFVSHIKCKLKFLRLPMIIVA